MCPWANCLPHQAITLMNAFTDCHTLLQTNWQNFLSNTTVIFQILIWYNDFHHSGYTIGMRRDIELCTMASWLVECSEVSVRHSLWVGATQQRHVARRCTVDSRNGSWRPLPICSLNHYHHDSFIKSAAKLPLSPPHPPDTRLSSTPPIHRSRQSVNYTSQLSAVDLVRDWPPAYLLRGLSQSRR